MIEAITLLASPEEALTLKTNIASHALDDAISAVCERSISLTNVFSLYLSDHTLFNNNVCNLAWQLQGNTDILNLYLNHYLTPTAYNTLNPLISKLWHLNSEIIMAYSSLSAMPELNQADTLCLIHRVKRLFQSIKTFCYETAPVCATQNSS